MVKLGNGDLEPSYLRPGVRLEKPPLKGTRRSRAAKAITSSVAKYIESHVSDTVSPQEAAVAELDTTIAKAKESNRHALKIYRLATSVPGYEQQSPAWAMFNRESGAFDEKNWSIGFDMGSGKERVLKGTVVPTLQFPVLELPSIELGPGDIVPVHYCLMQVKETPKGIATSLTLNGQPQGVDSSYYPHIGIKYGTALTVDIDSDGFKVVVGRDSNQYSGYGLYEAEDPRIVKFLHGLQASVQSSIDFNADLAQFQS